MNLCFFNDTATTEIYTLSLHDALPISWKVCAFGSHISHFQQIVGEERTLHRKVPVLSIRRFRHMIDDNRNGRRQEALDRKSTRLNSSHANISYAVFCLKKKKEDKSLNS